MKNQLIYLLTALFLGTGFFLAWTVPAQADYYDNVEHLTIADENLYRRIAMDSYGPYGYVPDFPVSGHELLADGGPIDPDYKKGVFFYVNDDSRMNEVLDMIIRKTKARLVE